MNANLQVKIHGPRGILIEYEVLKSRLSGFKIKIPFAEKINIELIDSHTARAPQFVRLKRMGKSLALVLDEGDINSPHLILEDYYDRDEIYLMGRAEDDRYYEFVPTSGDVQGYTPLIEDGAFSELALGGNGIGVANPSTDDGDNAESGFAWLPYLTWLTAAGAVIGVATLHKSSSRHDKSVTLAVNDPTDDDQNGYPEISGSSNAPNSAITVKFPDGTTITTKTDSEGNWHIEAPSSQPDGEVTVTITTEDGRSATIAHPYEGNVSPVSLSLAQHDGPGLTDTAESGQMNIITPQDPAGHIADPADIVRTDDKLLSDAITGGMGPGDDIALLDRTIASDGETVLEQDTIRLADIVGGIPDTVADESGTAIVKHLIDADTLGQGLNSQDWLTENSHSNVVLDNVTTNVTDAGSVWLNSEIGQALTLTAEEVLDTDFTGQQGEYLLKEPGEAGDSIDRDLSLWTESSTQIEQGINYDICTVNDDATVNLWIQQGMNIV